MSEFVEARSLAALNQLAANPPQYPKKPTEIRQDALTLYISRVPGTRDIILSTLKPQVKNVTAEDVASSLYYVHFQTHEDEPLVPPNQSGSSSSPRSSGESPPTQIHRKPIPNMPELDKNSRDYSATGALYGKENQDHRMPSRKPIAGMDTGALQGYNTPPASQLLENVPIHRKPLGPRPIGGDGIDPSVAHSQNVPHPLSQSMPPSAEERPPPLPARPMEQQRQQMSSANSPNAKNAHAEPLSPTKRRPFVPFSLTMIRRDRSSGQQWNVGKIASFQLENPELIDDERHHQPSPSVQIHLETSGYAKFRGMPTGADIGFSGSLDIRPGSSSSATRQQIAELNTHPNGSGFFERQVKMVYTPSFTANLRQRFRSRSSASEGRPPSPAKRPGHGRHGSQASIGSFGGEFEGSEAPVITQPAPGLKPRGYMFYSPWDGRCEFVTGNAGRSLKCRHVLPSYGSGVYNPLVEGWDNDAAEPKVETAQPVSELRFNLPTNELFSDNRMPEGGLRTRDHLQSQFQKMVAKAQGTEDSDDGYPLPFDLSLGREKAGGGNRGKRAKMGKLIIFDEGLKMLDLAVAANIGIWWITYERTYDS
ncbi:hypothetical protein GGR57DRAFT_113556 [Xylariaceae sp. FL1272]|nr:hypothetical protein GGR57DRAFT_113556 [Xylariaceae sp. FL1272]